MKFTVRAIALHPLGVALLALLCATQGLAQEAEPNSAGSPPGKELPEAPNWLEEALAREVDEPLPKASITVNDALDLEVRGKLESASFSDGTHDLFVNFGPQTSARCILWTAEMDLGGTVFLQLESLWAALADRLELRRLLRADARVVSEQPAMAIDWLYRVKSEEGSVVGLLKMRAARKRGHVTLCFHSELGYEESFDTFFEEYVGSLSFRDGGLEPTDPDYRELSITAVNGQNVGVEETALTRLENGNIREYSRETSLTPVDAETLQFSDSALVVTADSQGYVLSQIDAESESGDLLLYIELRQQEGAEGAWSASGTLQGKEFTASLQGPPMLSDYGMMKAVQKAIGSPADKRSLTLTSYLPSVDPAAFLDTTLSVGPQTAPPYDGELTLGSVTLAAKLDATGWITEIATDQEGISLVTRTEHTEGRLP